MYNMLLEISSELDSIKIMLAKSRILLLFPIQPCFQTKNCPIGSCRPSQDTPPNWQNILQNKQKNHILFLQIKIPLCMSNFSYIPFGFKFDIFVYVQEQIGNGRLATSHVGLKERLPHSPGDPPQLKKEKKQCITETIQIFSTIHLVGTMLAPAYCIMLHNSYTQYNVIFNLIFFLQLWNTMHCPRGRTVHW